MSTREGPLQDRSEMMSQLLDTIDHFERSLNEDLPAQLFATRKDSCSAVPCHSPHPRKPRRLKPAKARSISPLDRSKPAEDTSRLILNRFPPVLMRHLGPGCYNLESKPPARKQSFSPVPRFPALEEGLRLLPHSPATPQSKHEAAARIRKHISAMDDFKPGNLRLKLQEKAIREDFRAHVSRLARKEIEESNRKRHLEDLNEKFRRHEWRLRAEEISDCKRRWAAVLFYISSLHYWSHKQAWRHRLHQRSQGVLKFLLLMALCVGKILYKLRQKRYKRALVKLRRLTPAISRWLSRHKARMRESIAETVERSLSMAVFYQIIASWKRRIVLIQRCVKNWLQRRRAHKQFLLSRWTLLEPLLRRPEAVPDLVKQHFLDSFLKSRLQAHLFDLENWRARCETVEEAYKKLRFESLDDPPPLPKLPLKPFLSIFLTLEDVAGLVAAAEKKKYRWQRIVKGNKRQRKESFLDSENVL